MIKDKQRSYLRSIQPRTANPTIPEDHVPQANYSGSSPLRTDSGFCKPMRATKVVMNRAHTNADQNMMRWRPKRSIVAGSGQVPRANMVFMTAARS